MMTKKRRMNKHGWEAGTVSPWKCWYCKKLYFHSYTEAREHANQCRVDRSISAFFKEIFN
jgi:hypothetical protein